MCNADTEQETHSISFRQLELFMATARHRSVKRAATECSLSQPAAVHALSLLQERVGTPLLINRPSGSVPTAAGWILHERVTRAMAGIGGDRDGIGRSGLPARLRYVTPVHTRNLLAILDSGSLEAAAIAHSITIGSLRRSAAVLKQHFGALIEPTREATVLTATGRAIAEEVRRIRYDVALGVREARATSIAVAHAVTVGAAQAFGNRLLVRVLAEFAVMHPEARITVLREGPVELIGRLRSGEVDLVVGDIGATGPDLGKERLAETPYFVFARPGHPLSRPDMLTPADLAGYDWVGGTPASAREQARERLFADATLPKLAFAASEGALVGHFVAGSARLALMTEHESRCGGVALAKLPFAPIDSGLGVDVVRRADRAPSSLQDNLVELLRAHFAPGATMPSRQRHAA